ncbi:MAG: hypothetical protein ACTSUE_00195 [Promethearchaeota archaeon]
MKNLDQISMEAGFRLADETCNILNDKSKSETILTKTLGVLQEQGLYACILFCKSRPDSEKKAGKAIESVAKSILKDKLELIQGDCKDLLAVLREEGGLSSNLDDLMLAIQVLEKALIYGRYHAKAIEK